MHVCSTELLVVLGGRVGQVVEDYDASKCSVFYSDSNLVSAASPRPEPIVSGRPHCVPCLRVISLLPPSLTLTQRDIFLLTGED